MDDRKIVFALDIGTRSVVGIVGAIKDGNFTILDYEQEFHEKRAMRDGQIEDIDLVARVANNVKTKLEQRSGQTFTKVSIAAAGRALRTVPSSFSYDLIPNEPISQKIVQYMEYSAIEKAQEAFLSEATNLESGGRDYYCVGYSVTDYLLDDYKIKNLEGQKGKTAVAHIIAAFLPSSVLVSLYAVTARCGLEVDNLTLEPIAAIHAVVPDDVRFLNIALVDIGGGTSDIAISRDSSIVAYDMVTIAGDEITETLMKNYLTNFATAERIKLMLNGEEKIEFKDILGNQVILTPDEAFESVKETVNALAEAISQRILIINDSAPAAVFLVGGGSQIRGLCKLVAQKLGMPSNRVAIGVVNTDSNLSLLSENLYNPAFVTPIGIGIVSSLYRGCDFFAITVNGKRIMLFNHQNIKVIDALMFSGIKPSNLIGLTPQNLVYTLNGVKQTIKGTHGVPGELLVNGSLATIETEIKQGDEITVTLAKNGTPPSLTLHEVLCDFDLDKIGMLKINDVQVDFHDINALEARKISYMDQIEVTMAADLSEMHLSELKTSETDLSETIGSEVDLSEIKVSEVKASELGTLSNLELVNDELVNDLDNCEEAEFKPEAEMSESVISEPVKPVVDTHKLDDSELSISEISNLELNSSEVHTHALGMDSSPTVEINKIYSHDHVPSKVSLLLADDPDDSKDGLEAGMAMNYQQDDIAETLDIEDSVSVDSNIALDADRNHDDYSNEKDEVDRVSIVVTLNGSPVHLVQETDEPLILMHLLKYVDLDIAKPRGELVLKINGLDANYADPLSNHDVAVIRWSEDM